MSDFFVASILIFLSTFIPSLVPLILDKKSVQIQLLMSFVSGVLIAVTFYHLIPLSVQLQKEHLGYYILLGFLIFYKLFLKKQHNFRLI
jgi:zinc transporter ZupT